MVKFRAAAGSAGWHSITQQAERDDSAAPLSFRLRAPRRGGGAPFASLSLSADGLGRALGVISSTLAGSQASSAQQLQLLPVGSKKGGKRQQYVWDGRRIKPVNVDLLAAGYTRAGQLQDLLAKLRDEVRDAFLPNPREVTPDYWEWLRWRLVQRFFSSTMHNFATQSLLTAVGVGAKKAVAASAAINWMLKDGLGRLVRMTVATKFGQSFDSDLKRLRFMTSLLFTACISCEFLTPLYPQHFLLLASIANVGKAVGLTTFIATGPAFQQALCTANNLADITAKTQAQHMVVDTFSLMVSAALTYAVRANDRARLLLPLAAFPICAVGDLFGIWKELKAVQLSTLNRERSEMIADGWLASGRVPSMAEVASQESLLGPPNICGGVLPLRIVPLDGLVSSPDHLHSLLKLYDRQKYLLEYRAPEQDWREGQSAPGGSGGAGGGECSSSGGGDGRQQRQQWRGWWPPRLKLPWQRDWRRQACISVCLMDDVSPQDVLAAVLEAAHLRRQLRRRCGGQAGCCGGSGSCGQGAGCCSCEAAAAAAGGGDALPRLSPQQLQQAQAESRRFAQRNAGAFLSKVAAAGWQTRRVLLNTDEKQGFTRIAGA